MAENSKKTKKHHTVRPYITTPLGYVAISLIIIIPLCIVMLNVSVNLVHRAQKYFPPKVADFTLHDEGFTPDETESGSVEMKPVQGFTEIGELSCESAGFKTAVYLGNNRVSYRGGAGISTDASLPGSGGVIEVSANASGGFNALFNVKKGDVITFVMSWGKYKYKVFDSSVRNDYPKAKGETLYLKTAQNKNAFAALGENKLIVSATLVSGPEVKGVKR